MTLFARLALVALAGALASTSAAAAPLSEQGKAYAGFNLGKSEHTFSYGAPDKSDLAWKLYGGYQFTDTFGVEAGYVAHGEVSTGWEGRSKASTLYVAGTATVPLSAQFALIGKLGVADNRHKGSYPGWSGPTTVKASPMAGVGVTYAFAPSLTGVVEFEHFGKIYGRDSINAKASTLSVGVRKSF